MNASSRMVCRGIALLAGAALALFALGMYLVLPGATGLWIWPKTPPLGCVFVAAMFAGGAVPLVWIGLSGHLAAIRGAMVAGMVANTGIALHLFARHTLAGAERLLPFAAVFALGSILATAVLAMSHRLPATEAEGIPSVTRWSFLLFSAILLPVGSAMVLGAPYVFPIPLTTDMAAVYGWFFLGSFTYYLYGFWKPSRLNAIGPVLSFLVYDLLMIPPYAKYWASVPPQFRNSLLVYLSVLIASALFFSGCLLVDLRTQRIRRRGRSFVTGSGA